MMSGFTLRTSSTSMPSFAFAPGRKLVRKTSLRRISSCRISSPSAVSSARPMLRLPRLGPSIIGTKLLPRLMASRPKTFDRPRCASPISACSTLITSAPQSARTAAAAGTNVYCATSRLRTPVMGPVMVSCSRPDLLRVRFPRSDVPLERQRRQSQHPAGRLQGVKGTRDDAVVRDPLVPFLERDLELPAGEVRAEATVRARAERDVTVGRASDVHRRRVVELRRVSGGRRERQADHLPGLDGAALDLDVLRRLAGRDHDGVGAEELLDRGGDDGGVVEDALAVVGALGEV